MINCAPSPKPPGRTPRHGAIWSIISLLTLLPGLLTACTAGGQSPKAPPGQLLVQIVKELPGQNRRAIYEKARQWIGSRLPGGLDKIQYASRDQGVIVANSYLPHVRHSKWEDRKFEFRFEMMVETRDERMRASFNELALISSYGPDDILQSDMESLRPRLEALVEAMASGIRRPAVPAEW
ncbi:MAG: hypothetical protein CSB33_05310 [Desulfobacterales bacterium]|nr:MAG: hypothetical protein CSB33_05310 [Desulfobacterales bacterium]